MSRREVLASVLGALVAGVVSACLASSWEFAGGVWPSATIGTVFGAIGGALGQNFVEGLVIAGMGTVLVICLLPVPITLPWVREMGVGFFVGVGVGWFAHGSLA